MTVLSHRRRPTGGDNYAFFAMLRDLADMPILRGTFVQFKLVEKIMDGTMLSHRIRGPARAYRQLIARCLRIINSTVLIVKESDKIEISDTFFVVPGSKSHSFQCGNWTALFLNTLIPGHNSQDNIGLHVSKEEFLDALQSDSISRDILQYIWQRLSEELASTPDEGRKSELRKHMIVTLLICKYAESHPDEIEIPGHRVSLRTILGAEMLKLRMSSKTGNFFCFDPSIDEIKRNLRTELVDLLTLGRVISSPEHFVAMLHHMAVNALEMLSSFESIVSAYLSTVPQISDTPCLTSRLLASIVHERLCLRRLITRLQQNSFGELFSRCLSSTPEMTPDEKRLLDLSSSIEIYVEHLQKVFFGGRIECFRKSESYRISWSDLFTALRRHQALTYYRDARVVAESLYLFGYFRIDADKKSLILEKLEDDPMQSDAYLHRFQDVVDLERFRPFTDWLELDIISQADSAILEKHGGRAMVDISGLMDTLETYAHVTDYRAGSYRYTGVFLGDAAIALLIERGHASDVLHAQALMTVLMSAKAIRRVPLVPDEGFQAGRILYRLGCHQWTSARISQKKFSLMVDSAFMAGKAEHVTVRRHESYRDQKYRVCDMDYSNLLELIVNHIPNSCQDKNSNVIEFSGASFVSLLMHHVVCIDVPSGEFLGQVLLTAGVITEKDASSTLNNSNAFRSTTNSLYQLISHFSPPQCLDQTPKPLNESFIDKIHGLSSPDSIASLISRMKKEMPVHSVSRFFNDNIHYFKASEAIQFFQTSGIVNTYEEAMLLGQFLQITGAIKPLRPPGDFPSAHKFVFCQSGKAGS